MSYQESDDRTVTLTMSREDYECILFALGTAAGCASIGRLQTWLALMDRINEGNPHYTPYIQPKPWV